MCITLFCAFPSCCCTIATWPTLWSRVNKEQNFSFLFLSFDLVLSHSTPENFANIWQIKWNLIGSMKFETVWIQLLRDIFGLSSSRNVVTMATWCNNFSSLSREKVRMCNQMVVGEIEIIRIWTKNKWYCFLILWVYHLIRYYYDQCQITFMIVGFLLVSFFGLSSWFSELFHKIPIRVLLCHERFSLGLLDQV